MNDQSLRRLLRGLPGERAREGFTDRVLAGLNEGGRPAPRPRWQPRLAIAAAALAATVAAAGLVQLRMDQKQEMRQAEARRVLAELRAEHRQIERELRSLSEPRVYLGGDESVDLVVDLSQVHSQVHSASY